MYLPIDPSEQLSRAVDGVQPPEIFLQSHMNRLDIGGGVVDKLSIKAFGFESILADLRDDIEEYVKIETPFSPFLLTVKGQVGQGKTALVLNLIDELKRTSSFKYYQTWAGD